MPKRTTRTGTILLLDTAQTDDEINRNGFHPMKCQLYRGLCVCCPQYLCEKRKI